MKTNFYFALFKMRYVVLFWLFAISVYSFADETWNLTTNSYSSSSTTKVTWSGTNATMTLTKGSSSTNANNYLGGSYAHTRVYSGQTLSITPASGQTISSIEITATGSSYLISGTWTNGTATTSGSVTTITPTTGTSTVSCACNATKRLTKVVVKFGADCNKKVTLTKSSPVNGTLK